VTQSRVVLVHGSVGNAEATWGSVLEPLRRVYEVVLHTRSGYPPRPPQNRIDFEDQADELAAELRDGDHLVGHSYGGVVSLLAAARTSGQLASLTVNEPPAFAVAPDDPAVRAFVAAVDAIVASDPSPREYIAAFLPLVGVDMRVPERLGAQLEQGAQAALAERPPNEAEIPLDELAARPFRKLVVSGGHSPAFETVCDVLATQLPAERVVLPGAGHAVVGAPGYAEALVEFLDRA
jgi:pimeloyl-ACP methyl ester carboxylesterase